MDLSSLTAPDVGAIDPVLPTASLASFDLAVFKQAAQGLQSATLAVRQFARSTVDLGVDLGRVSQQTRPSYGVSAGTSSIGQIGGAAKLFSAGLGALTGIDLGGPISMGLQLFGLASSIFGGKPSVGPGGGAQFGLDATGKAVMGITNADNGYDPSVNQATADAVGHDAPPHLLHRQSAFARRSRSRSQLSQSRQLSVTGSRHSGRKSPRHLVGPTTLSSGSKPRRSDPSNVWRTLESSQPLTPSSVRDSRKLPVVILQDRLPWPRRKRRRPAGC